MAFCHEPGTPLNSSWISGVLESMLMATFLMPDSKIFLATSSVMPMPLVPIAILRPFSVPYLASSKMSFLIRGSPPLSTSTGLLTSAIWSMSIFPSSVVNSCALSLSCASM